MVLGAVAAVGGKILVRFMGKFVPQLIKTKNMKEGKELLWSMLRKEALEMSGVEGGRAIYEELKKNAKITYGKDGKVCIKYRKYKRCTNSKKE